LPSGRDKAPNRRGKCGSQIGGGQSRDVLDIVGKDATNSTRANGGWRKSSGKAPIASIIIRMSFP
jgi:hypothetical protein